MRVAPADPVIVTGVDDDTADVVTVNVRLVLPAETVTLAGTVATGVLLLDSDTTVPPDGAALVSVTVPCDVLPPTTVAGLNEIAESVGALVPAVTVRTAPHVVFSSAYTVACLVDDVDVVPMLKLALVAPAGTVTVDGTVAGLTVDSCTTAPPVGAGPLSVTVPVDDPPAATVEGLRASDVTPTVTPGLIVTFALRVDAPYAAVIVAAVVDVTGDAPNENRPCVEPADTITFAGRLIAGLFADSVTSTCPAGAGAVRFTNPTPP